MIEKWSVPECAGIPPAPCAAFSFNKIDQQRALLFGGRQREARVNELHVLNMDHWVCLPIIITITLHYIYVTWITGYVRLSLLQ